MKKQQTLLEKAKSYPTRRFSTKAAIDITDPNQLELVIAYFRSEVSNRQTGLAIGNESRGTGAAFTCASALRRAIAAGLVKIVVVKEVR